jgi:hypothetical protein
MRGTQVLEEQGQKRKFAQICWFVDELMSCAKVGSPL